MLSWTRELDRSEVVKSPLWTSRGKAKYFFDQNRLLRPRDYNLRSVVFILRSIQSKTATKFCSAHSYVRVQLYNVPAGLRRSGTRCSHAGRMPGIRWAAWRPSWWLPWHNIKLNANWLDLLTCWRHEQVVGLNRLVHLLWISAAWPPVSTAQ